MLWPFFILKWPVALSQIGGVLFIVSYILAPTFWLWAGVSAAWSVEYQRRAKRSESSYASDTDIWDDDCSDDSDSDDNDGGDSDGGGGD